jgi:4'-phosphopantetheinyl transferase
MAMPGAALSQPRIEPDHLAGRGIHLCDLDAGGAAGLAADRALLSPDERARADRFRFARDRDRYTRGRAFLRRRLAEATGRPAAALRFAEGAWGKPALACGTLEFNLSHSGGLAVLALSTEGPVGIDVELVDRSVDVGRLSESCFVAAERAVIDALGPEERRRRFFAFWTAKEALMKLTGQGMSLPPLDITLRLERGLPAGCLRPGALAGATLVYPDLGRSDAICCLALPALPEETP